MSPITTIKSSNDRIIKRRNRSRTSCLTCVKSKRKCDKQLPCSYCKMRNVPCQYERQLSKSDALSDSSDDRPLKSEPERPFSAAANTAGTYNMFGQLLTTPSTSSLSPAGPPPPLLHSSRPASLAHMFSTFPTPSPPPPPHPPLHRQPQHSGPVLPTSVPLPPALSAHSSSSSLRIPSIVSLTQPRPVSSPPASSSSNVSPALRKSSVVSSDGTAGISTNYGHEAFASSTSATSSYGSVPPCPQADFVIRLGCSKQLSVSQYYGPSSGPALLLCRGPYELSDANDACRFPKESVPNFVDIVDFYYRQVHWFIGCLEWGQFVSWLDDNSINEPVVNAIIYMVLSMSCVLRGRLNDANTYEQRALECCPPARSDLVAFEREGQSGAFLIFQVLRLHSLFMKGQFEELWIRLGMTINTATSMGYHRKWPYTTIHEQNKRSRLWYSILYMERMLALFLGRPYTVSDKFYDCENPADSSKFNYETSFRDSINNLVPIFGKLLDEIVAPARQGLSYEKLIGLDQDLSSWLYSINSELCDFCPVSETLDDDVSARRASPAPKSAAAATTSSTATSATSASADVTATSTVSDASSSPSCSSQSSAPSPPSFTEDCYPVPTVQKLYIQCLKNFLRSRIHRLFVSSPDDKMRLYCTEQFIVSNWIFCKSACQLLKHNVISAIQGLTSFVVDNALFYAIKTKNCTDAIAYNSCMLDSSRMLRDILQAVVGKCFGSATQMAASCLRILDALDSHGQKNSLAIASNLPHPMEHHAAITTTGGTSRSTSTSTGMATDLKIYNSAVPPQNNKNNLTNNNNRPALDRTTVPSTFDPTDWEIWLRDLDCLQ